MRVYVVFLNCRKELPTIWLFTTKEKAWECFNNLPEWAKGKYEYDQYNSYVQDAPIDIE